MKVDYHCDDIRNEEMRDKTVLVTGGAGFVGSSLCFALVNNGARVTVLDDLFTGKTCNIEGIDLEFIRGSVSNEDPVRKLISRNFEYIFHLAARNIIVSTRSPLEDFEVNARGTLNLLLACKDLRNRRLRRFLYTSSASVYGNPQALPLSEHDGVAMLSPYATSKYTGENYCMCFYEAFGLPCTIVRYSNVYGINQNETNPYCGVIGRFMANAFRGENLEIHGDGLQTRDFTFTSDAIAATIAAALHPRGEGEVFNVATGMETSILDLAHRIISIVGDRRSHIAYIDRRDIDNIRRRVLSIEKIRRMVRWSPCISLDVGLALTKEHLSAQLVK